MLSRRLLRIKVIKALFAHIKSGADNMMASEKTLMASVGKAYDLYFQILVLPVEIARYAEQRQEIAKQKKLPTFEDLNPNTKFVDNAVIRTIANSDAVNDRIAARKLGWTKYPEIIRTLYTQLTESEYYKEYMLREERSFDDDKRLLENFFKELQNSESLDDVLEEISMLWTDDLPYIIVMILRTLAGFPVSGFQLLAKSQAQPGKSFCFRSVKLGQRYRIHAAAYHQQSGIQLGHGPDIFCFDPQKLGKHRGKSRAAGHHMESVFLHQPPSGAGQVISSFRIEYQDSLFFGNRVPLR